MLSGSQSKSIYVHNFLLLQKFAFKTKLQEKAIVHMSTALAWRNKNNNTTATTTTKNNINTSDLLTINNSLYVLVNNNVLCNVIVVVKYSLGVDFLWTTHLV